jgi:hypothetical protein
VQSVRNEEDGKREDSQPSEVDFKHNSLADSVNDQFSKLQITDKAPHQREFMIRVNFNQEANQ